ncbi:Glucose dehydrogenase [Frankia canadensis]|uniref:Glucose dehydrogenase n=1 Tax=Frankia canadensis TaxID=1836972 RepID=A0A2I2KS31_9ACTN|nr:SDR family NAD(P)-dependent oxidoreductase [Frankia canadensis]SNQ48470.1 Glucose dehydrogenase [Frankia canadensis]SOU55760.1 Glucose dehydrogenase [Frankia canadensis]
MSHLSAPTVLITGSSSGIGLDAARSWVADGANVVLNGTDRAKLDRAAQALGNPEQVLAVPGDISDPATGRAMVDGARERFGRVDVLVNNAGVFGAGPFLDSTLDDLDRYYAVNVRGTFVTTQAVVPALIEAGGGAIVNVGSLLVDAALLGVPASAQTASKGAVHALTVSWAAEFAPHRIRVNALVPGMIRTPLHGGGADGLAGVAALNRVGEVAETTQALRYLAAAEFVTGTLLRVDGGYHGARAAASGQG